MIGLFGETKAYRGFTAFPLIDSSITATVTDISLSSLTLVHGKLHNKQLGLFGYFQHSL